MPELPVLRYPIVQHAWYVTDIEAACTKWNRVTGAGPFFMTREHWGDRHMYRGTDTTVPFDYAFGYSGDTQVQFCQQNHEGPSIYRDMFAAGEEGFHHVAMLVPDDDIDRTAAEFEAAGFPVASSLWSIANVIYVDARKAIGCFLECHGDNAQIREVFANWKKQHDEWDGHTDLIRGNRGQKLD
jgi:catechol 2,3-dioxygenase-like lactoylglutathione lyase family enzyme